MVRGDYFDGIANFDFTQFLPTPLSAIDLPGCKFWGHVFDGDTIAAEFSFEVLPGNILRVWMSGNQTARLIKPKIDLLPGCDPRNSTTYEYWLTCQYAQNAANITSITQGNIVTATRHGIGKYDTVVLSNSAIAGINGLPYEDFENITSTSFLIPRLSVHTTAVAQGSVQVLKQVTMATGRVVVSESRGGYR